MCPGSWIARGALAASCAAMARGSRADEIRFEHSGSGSGTLAGVPFTARNFTIVALGETDARYERRPGVFAIAHTRAWVWINGFGNPLFFSSPTETFLDGPRVGLGHVAGPDLFLGPSDPALLGWTMLDTFPKTFGEGSLVNWAAPPRVQTDRGELVFDDGLAPARFKATLVCYANCDSSTGQNVLDIFDFLCWMGEYNSGAPYACDCDTSTGVWVCDVFDFLCFQNAYAAGCP